MTPTQVGIKLNDTTSASELDSFFTQVWSQDRRVKIVLDATDCKDFRRTYSFYERCVR